MAASVLDHELWQLGALADPNHGPVLDLGPEHPMRTGLLQLHVAHGTTGITDLDVVPGWCHRGAEKLFEVRDARQVLMLADRHDWQAAFVGEVSTALAAEELLGLQPPPRATMLRTLLVETARITSHLSHLTFLPFSFQENELAAQVRLLRERARVLMVELSGNRVHPMLTRLGGLAADPSSDWLAALDEWLTSAAALCDPLLGLADRVRSEFAGVATVSDEVMDAYGLSGPTTRSAGRSHDLRRSGGLLAYDQLGLGPGPSSQGRDAGARFAQWCLEVSDAAEIAQRCLRALEPGPVSVQLSRIIRFPEGEAWVSLEAPQGQAAVFLVARGERTPWRLKLRTPSFNAVSSWSAVLPGTPLELLAIAVASLPYTIGDLDK